MTEQELRLLAESLGCRVSVSYWVATCYVRFDKYVLFPLTLEELAFLSSEELRGHILQQKEKFMEQFVLSTLDKIAADY